MRFQNLGRCKRAHQAAELGLLILEDKFPVPTRPCILKYQTLVQQRVRQRQAACCSNPPATATPHLGTTNGEDREDNNQRNAANENHKGRSATAQRQRQPPQSAKARTQRRKGEDNPPKRNSAKAPRQRQTDWQADKQTDNTMSLPGGGRPEQCVTFN